MLNNYKSFRLAVLFVFLFCNAYSQNQIFQVKNYTTKDYGRDFHPANMAVVQDQRGLIYAANGFKLLEFDGKNWNSYPINREAWILSLAIDSSGLIYAGSQNEFGFFEPEKSGKLRYVSLSDSLEAEEQDFTNIWKVHAFSGAVIFQAEEKIFVYRKGKIEIIRPSTSFHTSFTVSGNFYVRERGKGILTLGTDGLLKVPGSEVFDTTGIFLMEAFRKDRIIIGTRDKGFWLFDPAAENAPFTAFRIRQDLLIEKSVITGGTVTVDGSLALGTMMNGIIIVDSTGTVRSIVNNNNGLGDNDIKQLITDRAGDLWAAMNNGLARIAVASPVSVYIEKAGIEGQVNAVLRFQGLLYSGTSTGLVVQTEKDITGTAFRQVAGIKAPVRCLASACGKLYAGTDEGLFMIYGDRSTKIGGEAVYSMFLLEDRKILLTGGPSGLDAFNCEKNNSRISSLSLAGEDIIAISGSSSGSNVNHVIWLGTRYNGVLRLNFGNDNSISYDHYGTADGLPDGPVIPSFINGEFLFGTIRGLYSFTDENAVKQSLPDSLKNNSEFVKGFFSSAGNKYKFPGESVSVLAEVNDKIWICSDNNAGWLDKSAGNEYNSKPFSGIDAGKINCIYPEENGICWVGATEGLIRFDGNIIKDYSREYPALIRKVTLIEKDTSIYHGSGYMSRAGGNIITPGQGPDQLPVLKFSHNSLRFDFAATDFAAPDKLLFSYRLGKKSGWSQWSRAAYQELTNIREGEYVFSVRAKNVFGTVSVPGEFRFTILPPWYRSWPAYILYLLLSAFLLWTFARIYSYRLKKENIRLEGIITERTAEIVRQKDEIVDKNIILEHQKKEIEDSIKYASRIQSAVIPSEKACRELYPETFVLFRPLNIVSGDFYWISRVGQKIVYTAADCTGHGVPGAFMSMLGVAFLNEIVNKDHITSPELILNNVREKVIHALQQQGITGEARDGMDIAIVSVDTASGILEYAGAYNPLIMIRDGVLTEFPGEKMPIGYYENMHGFSKHQIKIEAGDMYYMYSDGYEDQFGGADGKKFKSKRLKNLLLEISGNPVEKQKEILAKQFDEWKGDNPQIDDVVMVGMRISEGFIA